jgi:hypothetical protein
MVWLITQGLGFATAGGFASLPDKKDRLHGVGESAPTGISSMFVRAGESSKREISAAEAVSIARREADSAAQQRREAADGVARRMAELKRAKQSQLDEDRRYGRCSPG